MISSEPKTILVQWWVSIRTYLARFLFCFVVLYFP